MFSALLKVRARARFYSYATKIFVCRDRVEASGGNGVDVVKYWNAAIACSKAMKFSVIASKRTMFVFRRGEGKKVRALLSFHIENSTPWNSLLARAHWYSHG
ncbi:hypothetical protein V6N13_106919 [Hibiscus sabdariffa]